METIELNINVTFGRKNVFLLLVLFFLCWRPGFLNSESLTLTTYYPAPYGGYVSLLTTQRTLLARDGGMVGIRTGSVIPRTTLDVHGEIATASKLTLTQDTASSSLTWHLNNDGGRFKVSQQPNITTAGTERMTILSNGFVGINTATPTQRLHVANGTIKIETGNLRLSGDGTASGEIIGLCSLVSYTTTSGFSSCGDYGRPIAYYGDGEERVEGFLLKKKTGLSSEGTYIILGQDWGGTMLCCRIP